ncbi:MAG: glycyl-radical enzyme activating protein [Deltaproteobacteria bacterium HGW-Deltaproteobacteria-11]|nr:MAG: glycyl-radical enzyme activating protein [Deltaproteobacteria bacterium HGW-Deltaproteobacteria-11]
MGAERNAGTPLILEIRGNSLDDGPGIRSVIFFKGCPLSCVWCHNPECKRTVQEIAFDANECVGCDTCLTLCPEAALSRGNRYFIDRTRCTLCFKCADACPSGALSRVGREMKVGEIIEVVMKDKPFFDTSGGGVTLSGGEPALFMDFTAELLACLKARDIHTLLETCGAFDMGKFQSALMPYLDAVYFDIKLIDDDAHRRFTGTSNERILDNFKKLVDMTRDSSVTVLPRTPLVPGITDTDGNMEGIAAFLAGLGVRKAALLSYNPLWHVKADKIGVDDPLRQEKSLTTWTDPARLKRCRDAFINAGIGL